MTKRSIDFSTVLASSVHDMKNSLCLLIQSIENLSNQFSENQQESKEIAQIHYEASRLNSNLLQMLSLYRARKDALPINIEEWYLDDLIDELIAKNTLYIKNKQIDVELDIETDLAWYFDNDLVANLLNDIFVNAMRYCQHKIFISAHQSEQGLEVTICDDGSGYPEHMLISSNTQPKDIDLTASRTGLGIYFAKLIASSHQQADKVGSISLENGGVLNGSVFRLVLP
jgi:K+-sensing histidine kinase KdpD